MSLHYAVIEDVAYFKNGLILDKNDLKILKNAEIFLSKGYFRIVKNGKITFLHRALFKKKERSGFFIDHINGDRKDCRRCNLRLSNAQENARNRKKQLRGNNKFKGVTLDPRNNKFRARITVSRGKKISLGSFVTEIEAAKAYDQAAIKYFGKFAKLNFSNE